MKGHCRDCKVILPPPLNRYTQNNNVQIIMGEWGSQATVPFIKHINKYVQISSILYKRKNKSTKAGHENPKKPAGGKNTGNVYPRPKQWCNPWGFRVCKDLNYKRK